MYKLLLCLRYLRTRPIGLASIISVMLGVMTMIVVNAVMEGFSVEMRAQMHGVLSDVIVEARSLDGEPNADMYLSEIKKLCGDKVLAASEVVATPAMLSFRVGSGYTTREVQLVGVDPERQGAVTEFRHYLQHPENRREPSFDLREDGYPDHEWNPAGRPVCRDDLAQGGWKHRRNLASYEQLRRLGRSPRPVDEPQMPPSSTPDDPTLPPLPTLEFPDQSIGDTIVGAENEANTEGENPGLDVARNSQDSQNTEVLPPSDTSLPGVLPSRIESPASLPSLDHLNQDAVFEPTAAKGNLDSQSGDSGENTETAGLEVDGENASLVPTDPFVEPGADPFDSLRQIEGTDQFDMAKDQNPGVIPGIAIVTARIENPQGSGQYEDRFQLIPGNDVNLTFLTVGDFPQACCASFTIVDFYESRMSQYDRSFVFVPIRTLQEMRGMIDPVTGQGGFSQILIRVKEGVLASEVSRILSQSDVFPPELFRVYTWEEKDDVRDLLNAVRIELMMINLLLFLIIAVAGFGILAIFFMIVFEKTRDIGIMKSLGASGSGVMAIFLAYGLALGCVGSLLGLGLGLLLVKYINVIAGWLAKLTGVVVFDPTIYYLYEIPTEVIPSTVVRIILGSLAIAVVASVLPAIRAARLRPVRALRHE